MLSRAIALAMILLLPRAAEAMEFQFLPSSATAPVLASGPILPGDAYRLAAALAAAQRDPRGLKLLLLDSEGGYVQVAYAMAGVIEAERVSVAVAPGRTCESACTLLFIAGVDRGIGKGGYLGFHSCRNSEDNSMAPLCNEQMMTFAQGHGVAGGTIGAFTTLIPPDQMLYLDQAEADCWGLTRYFAGGPEGHGRCIDEMIADIFERCGKDGLITEEQMQNCQ